jgi:hypothetical protein
MSGIARLLFVSGLAVVGFVVAIFAFQEVPASECQAQADRNPAYQVRIEPNPPDVNLTTYTLHVTHAGQPVSGARVCMRADMGGAGNMSGMGTSALAKQVGPGRYELGIRFEMGGHWEGRSLIWEGNKSPVEVPVNVEAK